MNAKEIFCLKCLTSSIGENGQVVYDYPGKDGKSPDCKACLEGVNTLTVKDKEEGGDKQCQE